ncbi:MAG: hypothetical protein JXX28_12395 [Deltaproteobacteria bacterium]|nr:hypothetical protein [Deltaproteobacteria bacterium]
MRYLTLMALSLVLGGEALADSPMRLCVRHSLATFVDVGYVGDDFLNDKAVPVPAYGVKARVTLLGNTLFDDYVDEDTGCTPLLPVTRGAAHRVRLYGDAEVDGNRVKVWGADVQAESWELDDGDFDEPVYDQDYIWYPSTLPLVSTGYLTTQGEPAWHIAAVVGHALRRDNGGITGQTFRLIYDDAENSSAHSERGRIRIGGEHSDKKTVIAHELGHALQAFARGSTEALDVESNHDYSLGLVNDACTSGMWADASGHRYNSREYQSAAVHEGFAHFYAALAFNRDDEYNCSFKPYRDVDWNNDGYFTFNADLCCDGKDDGNTCGTWSPTQTCYYPDMPETSVDHTGPVSCETTPAYYGVTELQPPTHDHLTYCTDLSRSGLVRMWPDGTPYDWMRFFWDVHTNTGGISLEQILQVYGAAGANNWIATSPAWYQHSDDYPAARLLLAAEDQGVGVIWEAQGTWNGVHTDAYTGGY